MRRVPQDDLNRYSLSGSPFVNGFKNRVINGNFDLWQRGTSLGAGTGARYLADRWVSSSVGSTIEPSQQAFTLGQTSVPGEPAFFHRCVVASSAGAGNNAFFVHRVESARTLAGQTCTVSFWAKADASKNIAIEFVRSYGTGGSPSALDTALAVFTAALTTSFQKFTFTATVPSLLGKTLGTNGDDYLQMQFWFDAGSTFNSRTNSLGQQSGTFDIAQVQVEPGPVATEFEQRPLVQELAMAQRYYEKSFQLTTTPVQNAGVGTGEHRGLAVAAGAGFAGRFTVKYSVRKRASATVTFYNPAAANAQMRDLSASADCSNTAAANSVESSFEATATQNAATLAGSVLGVHWTADAEF